MARNQKRKLSISSRKLEDAATFGDFQYPAPHGIPSNRSPTLPLCLRASPKERAHPLQVKALWEHSALPNTMFFPDTSFFSSKPPYYLIEQLLGRMQLTPFMLQELKPWNCNSPIRCHVSKSLTDLRSGINILSDDGMRELNGFDHYSSLLRYRKEVGEAAANQLRRHSGDAMGPAEFQNLQRDDLQSRFGARGFPLAIKGWQERKNSNRFADEEVVTAAILTAISSGRETAILTFDNDMFNQFTKLAFLLREDYLSMLVAESFQERPYYFPRSNFVLSHDFEGQSGTIGIGLKLRHADVWNLIPWGRWTNIYCMLFGNDFRDLRISSASMCCPLDMIHLLKTKQKTASNTELLGGRNCRVRFGKSPRGSSVAAAMIGYDEYVRFNDRLYAWLDLTQVLREEDGVVFPVIEGTNSEHQIRRDSELLISGRSPGLFFTEQAKRQMEADRRRHESKMNSLYLRPIIDERFKKTNKHPELDSGEPP